MIDKRNDHYLLGEDIDTDVLDYIDERLDNLELEIESLNARLTGSVKFIGITAIFVLISQIIQLLIAAD